MVGRCGHTGTAGHTLLLIRAFKVTLKKGSSSSKLPFLGRLCHNAGFDYDRVGKSDMFAPFDT